MNIAMGHSNQTGKGWISKVSHEARTPLNAILGFTELLREGVYGPVTQQQHDVLNKIEDSSHTLYHLINRTIELGRIVSGCRQAQVTSVAVKPFLTDVQGAFRALFSDNKPGYIQPKNFELRIDEGNDTIFVDPLYLKDILWNLVENCVDNHAESIVIHLHNGRGADRSDSKATEGNKCICITVIDNGPGIPEEYHPKLFDEFFCVPREPRSSHSIATREIRRHTGLGLPIAKALATSSGGDISFKSRVGHGSEFTVTLPHRTIPLSMREEVPNS